MAAHLAVVHVHVPCVAGDVFRSTRPVIIGLHIGKRMPDREGRTALAKINQTENFPNIGQTPVTGNGAVGEVT